MTRRTILTVLVFAAAAAGAAFSIYQQNPGATATQGASRQPASAELIVAAPGRVEPASEEVDVASEIGGRLESVSVEEGDPVRAGQTVAVISNAEYRAAVATAAAELEARQADLRLVINGARASARREASAAVAEAEAVARNADTELARRRSLFSSGVIAREEVDRAEREAAVARARAAGSRERFAIVDDDAREEDRAKAEAAISMARARLAEAEARLAKTIIRAPIDGIVLRKHMLTGESVSMTDPSPIVTIANTGVMRVRAEIDERDVARVRIGDEAWVSADAFGDRRFPGRVIRIGRQFGRKEVRTDEPVEKIDTKVLEVLIELADGRDLPTGMRVDAFVSTRR